MAASEQIKEAAKSEAKSRATNYAGKQIMKTGAGKAVKGLAAQAGKKLASSAVGTAAKAAAGLATGGASLAAQAALAAAANADKIAKAGMGLVGAVTGLIGAGVSAAVPTAMSQTAIALLAVPITVALLLTIINTGAYIVPPSESIFFDTSVTGCSAGEPETYECFIFDQTWGCGPDSAKNNVKQAIDRVLARPNAETYICSQTIGLSYSNRDTGYGGEVINGRRDILFHIDGTSSSNGTRYTLAHEIGHVLYQRFPSVLTKYGTVSPTVADGQFLPSYPFCDAPYQSSDPGCNSFENIAEAIGLWLYLPTQHSEILNFQGIFPAHYEFAQRVFQ